jgi:drug/metabolite transporter (DMT)-like permease
MKSKHSWQANVLLLLTAAIWGGGFVAQRLGMAEIGAFTFNAIRFGIGSLLLLLYLRSRGSLKSAPGHLRGELLAGAAAGVLLCLGSYFQTAGMIYTTAGKAGFITGLYVVLVPLLGLFWQQKTGLSTWLGALLAAGGLYLLSFAEATRVNTGDLLVMVSAFFWAAHVQLIGYLSRRSDPLKISVYQFVAVTILSLVAALLLEETTLDALRQSALPLLYGGVFSVAIAFTLQVIAQREAHPAHAAIIFSLETVFAGLAGWLILNEQLSPRALAGCGLMLAGMVFSQIGPYLNLWTIRRKFLKSTPPGVREV